MSRLRQIFASTEAPLTWRLAFGTLLGGALGALAAYFLNPDAVVMAAVTGAMLSVSAVVGPLVVALRTVLVMGAITAVAVSAATASLGITWLSATLMALLAFSSSLWSVIPIIGQVAAGFPALLFLMVTANGPTLTSGSDWATVGRSAVIGIAAAVLATALLHVDDPRRGSRQAVARSWAPDATLLQQGTAAQMLQFDGRPRRLSRLLTLAIRATLARQLATSVAGASAESPGVRAGRAGNQQISAVLMPRGRLVPRVTDPDTGVLAAEARQSRGPSRFGLDIWRNALTEAGSVLAGGARPSKPPRVAPGLVRQLVRQLVDPDSPSFRFGVQKAVAMGVGMAVLLTVAPGSMFWILLTVLAVLQGDAPTTGIVAAARAAGTVAGAVGGLLLAFLLPPGLLYPWLAIAVMFAGIVLVARNYALMVAATAMAVVWFAGVPDGSVWLWAGLRVLDTGIGVLIAFLVTNYLLPVRPDPVRRHSEALADLGRLLEWLQLAVADPRVLDATVIRLESRIGSALANYRSEVATLPEEQRRRWEEDLAGLDDLWHRLNALLLLLVSDVSTAGADGAGAGGAATGPDADLAAERDAVVRSGLAVISARLTELGSPGAAR